MHRDMQVSREGRMPIATAGSDAPKGWTYVLERRDVREGRACRNMDTPPVVMGKL